MERFVLKEVLLSIMDVLRCVGTKYGEESVIMNGAVWMPQLFVAISDSLDSVSQSIGIHIHK